MTRAPSPQPISHKKSCFDLQHLKSSQAQSPRVIPSTATYYCSTLFPTGGVFQSSRLPNKPITSLCCSLKNMCQVYTRYAVDSFLFSRFFLTPVCFSLLRAPSSVQQSSAFLPQVARVLSSCDVCILPHIGIPLFFISLVFFFLVFIS